MRYFAPTTLACTLFATACTSSPLEQRKDQTSAPALVEHHYVCESGAQITASYHSSETALVHYKENTYDMKIAVSGSGSRYLSDELEWWTKGSGSDSHGTLFRHSENGSTGDIIERCTAL